MRPKVLALVLAGGTGSRLELLTDERAKPAMPFAGVYRLIDFPLTNCVHSGISDVWIIEQYQPHSLDEHVSNGRPWDLDRTHGGLRLLTPHRGSTEGGWHRGNADAIYRHKSFIRESGARLLVVLSSDHVYTLDYRGVVSRHMDADSAVTMVTTKVAQDDAGRFGVVQVGDDARVTRYDYKPEDPQSDLVTTEVYVFDADTLLDLLEELAEDSGEDDEESVEDFGDALLPRLVDAGAAREYRLDGYWRDVGTVDSYWRAHMELLGPDPEVTLGDPQWPILTHAVQRPPARIAVTAALDEGLVSPGCTLLGEVTRSVLAPGVVVEEGAAVRDSVVLHDTVVRAGATVEHACPDLSGADEVFRIRRAWQLELAYGSLLDEHRALMKPDAVWNIELGRTLTGPDLGRAERLHAALYQRVHEFFQYFDVLLAPVSQVVPFDVELVFPRSVAGVEMTDYLEWMGACSLITMTGCPALSVPAGCSWYMICFPPECETLDK
jgi:glucose-1-phosphate adenylyltransferase